MTTESPAKKSEVNSEIAARRIALSTAAYDLLSKEVDAIRRKGIHFKVNENKLANAIIECFFTRYLEKERKQIEELFFDKRMYLKSLIEKATSEEDLSAHLKRYLQPSKRKYKSKKSNEAA